MVNHINKMRVIEFCKKISLNFEDLKCAGFGKINFECVKLVVFAGEVDTWLNKSYLACPPSPSKRWM